MSRLDKFTALLANKLKGFKVKFKDESTLMKIIGALMFFNKAFMTGFVTTLGYTVYFPNKDRLQREVGAMKTLSHEYVHAKDAHKFTRPLFGALYLFPQLLGILALLAWLVLGPLLLSSVITWSWVLWIPLGMLLFLAPLPAPLRTYYELRGYKMSLFAQNEFMKEAGHARAKRLEKLKLMAESYNKQFTSGNYYFMWPFGVEGKLTKAAEDIVSGAIWQDDKIYAEIAQAIKDSK